jgi:hypothetical protein
MTARSLAPKRAVLVVSVVCVALSAACGPPASVRLDCSNLLPPEESHFSRIAAVVTNPDSKGKGCAPCHNGFSPTYGLNMQFTDEAWDVFSTKMHLVYPMLATGQMPATGHRWSDDELRVVRSWYCRGALYDVE